MARFTDSESRDWDVRVTAWTVREVKRNAGVLLTAIGDDNFALLQQLCDPLDPTLLLTVLWECVRDQAADRGVDERSFAMALGGDVLETATRAFMGELTNFFADPALRRALQAILEKEKQTREIAAAAMLEKINAIDPTQLAQSFMTGSSTPPPSPASSPGDTPLASSTSSPG